MKIWPKNMFIKLLFRAVFIKYYFNETNSVDEMTNSKKYNLTVQFFDA